MPHSALAAFLTRLCLRSELNDEEAEAILSLDGHIEHRARHEDLVLPGDRTKHACLMIDGLAGRYDQTETGARQYTALHMSGDMCDLQSAILPVATCGIEALNPVTILRVSHSGILGVAAAFPAIAMAFWRDTTADSGILTKWAGNLGRKPALARMAHLICEIGTRMQQAGLGTRTDFPLSMTQDQLADTLGLTAVHVNRTLQTLRTNGLVRTSHKRMEVLDWARLAAIAEFQEEYLQYLRRHAPAPGAGRKAPLHAPHAPAPSGVGPSGEKASAAV